MLDARRRARRRAAPPGSTSPPTTSSAFAGPAEQLPAARRAPRRRDPGARRRAASLARGLVPPEHARPRSTSRGAPPRWAVGVARDAPAALDGAGPLVLAAADTAFRRQVGDALTSAGVAVTADARRRRGRDRHRRAGAARARRASRQGARRVDSMVHGGLRAHARGEGPARRRLLGALQGASARRLLVLLLPGGQPPRRRGPHGADVPAGLPALRARAAGVRRAAAAAVADPHRAQPRGELLPRPVAQAADADRRRGRAVGAAHDGGPRRGSRRAGADPRRASSSCRTTAARR